MGSTDQRESSTLSQVARSQEPNLKYLLKNVTPVQDAILGYLTIKDILSLRLVARAFSNVYSIATHAHMNINHGLKTFFSDPVAFRNVQARCNAIITGLFVLEFLSRGHIQAPTNGKVKLRLLVEEGRSFDDLSTFLVCNGYDEMGGKRKTHTEGDTAMVCASMSNTLQCFL